MEWTSFIKEKKFMLATSWENLLSYAYEYNKDADLCCLLLL